MLMRCTEGVETDYVDSSAFSPVGGILGYDLAERERAWSLEDHPETSETDPHPVTILDGARDEFARRQSPLDPHVGRDARSAARHVGGPRGQAEAPRHRLRRGGRART